MMEILEWFLIVVAMIAGLGLAVLIGALVGSAIAPLIDLLLP